MNHNKIVDLVHVGFLRIFITDFLKDGLIDVLLSEVGNFYVSLGTIDAHICDNGWHLRDEQGLQCLGHDGCLAAIVVGRANVPIQLLHHPGELV